MNTTIESSIDLTKPQNRVPLWVMPVMSMAVFAVDAILAAACFLAAFKLRDGNPILSQTAWAWSREFVPYAGILFFAIPVRLAMLVYQRAYRFYGAFTYTQEAIKVAKATVFGSLLLVAWAFLFRGGFSFREYSYSRGIFVIDFFLALTVFVGFHLGLRFVQTLIRERGINLIPTLVVGTNNEARQTILELRERKYLGYRVFGVVEGSESNVAAAELDLDDGSVVQVLGGIDDLSGLIRRFDIREVIITDNSLESERLFDAMMGVGRSNKVEFRFAPSLFDLLPQKTSVDQIGVLPMVRLFREPLSDAQRFLKRLSDLIIAVVAGMISLPIWSAVAIAVKLDSPGAVLFKQERVGMDGRVFLCYKFRSMRADSDESLHREAYQKNIDGHEAANAGDEDKPVFGKVKDDPRITRVGRFIRRSSLDELPQLLNVIWGEMSIVGPRPPIPYEVEGYEKWHRKRLDMKPGITGLWQVSGRNRLTFEEMVRVDLYYIEHWSLLLDAKILLLTIPAVLRGDGAR